MIANHIVAATGKSFDELFSSGKVRLAHRDGKYVITKWELDGHPEPTQAQIDAWVETPDIHGLLQHAYARMVFIPPESTASSLLPAACLALGKVQTSAPSDR
jgi:hypothetical protein